ncbi:hypothetical protein D3C71_1464050 [compost metagenome]
MIISVVSPYNKRVGNTVTAILLAMGLGGLKRKVLLSHVLSKSNSFHRYLGLKHHEDKTTTPAQLVKLMREGAIVPSEIGDYCKLFDDYVDVFTNNADNFSDTDMTTLLNFLLVSPIPHEYTIFDIDDDLSNPTVQSVLNKSEIIILNVAPDFVALDNIVSNKSDLSKVLKNKKVILNCSQYNPLAMKTLKGVSSYLGFKTSCCSVRDNSWIKWACNNGVLLDVYRQGRKNDTTVIDIYKDISNLTNVVTKTKIIVNKEKRGVDSGK